MEASQEVTKAQFLREKMTNMCGFIYDKLDDIRLQFPELKIDTKDEALKKFNSFKDEEEKLVKEGELFDRTKHFCLNVLGGVELSIEGNNLEKAQCLLFVRKIASVVIAQAVVAKKIAMAVESKKETGEIPKDEEVDLTDPNVANNILNEQERIELQALVANVTVNILKIMKDEDWLRICAYINCFIDTVTNS